MSPLKLALGVMTAIGGFVDIGNLVTSGVTGARFGMALTWAIILGTVGMTVYGEMAGRVAAVGGRAVFHSVRERLGPRVGLVNLTSSFVLSLLTLSAEIGGVALVLQLATGINYLLWVPLVGLFVWLVIYRAPFMLIENVFGMMGLGLIIFIIALFKLPVDWHGLWVGATHPWVPSSEPHSTYWFYAVSLYGACLVPYQVLFFSSGGREESWTTKSIPQMRMNAVVGFPLGGLLSIAIMASMIPIYSSLNVNVSHLGQIALPVAASVGLVGLIFALIGFFAATFAAAAEAALSAGYAVAQFFGWTWGKMHEPRAAAQFHVVCLASIIAATGFILTTIDPITVTLVSVVLGAVAIPLTYFPVLVVANDEEYMGKWVNGRLSNVLGSVFLVIMVLASVVTLPLLFITKAGH